MAFKAINPEKIVSCCPVGMRKSQCPSIGVTRRLRKEIFAMERMPEKPLDKLEALKKKLRDKKNAGIAADCPTCIYNKPKQRTSKPAAKVAPAATA